MQPSGRRWIFLGIVVGLIVAADQIAKRIIVASLIPGESSDVLSPYFQITRSHNTGSAFGFLPQAGDFLLVIAIVITAAMLFYYPRIAPGATLMRVASGLIIGGAIGNAVDRVQYGFVIDFIHYQIPGLISNVSNLADHAIVIGVGLVFIDGWLNSDQETAEEPIVDGGSEAPAD